MVAFAETSVVSFEIEESVTFQSYIKPKPPFACLKHFYSLLLALFYFSNLMMFIACLWLMLMEHQSYILDVKVFPDRSAPMKWVVGLGTASGAVSMLVSSFGILGLYGKVRYVLSVFISGLAIVSFMQVAMGLIAREFKTEFDETALKNYTYDLARHRYGTDESAKQLMDKIQYYNDCCGAEQPEDYYFSEWFMQLRDTENKAFVPLSCCKMSEDSTFSNMKPLHATCIKTMYTAKVFQYLVKDKGCSSVFKEKVLQLPTYFEFLGLSMACFTVFVLIFVLLMIDKELYYNSLIS